MNQPSLPPLVEIFKAFGVTLTQQQQLQLKVGAGVASALLVGGGLAYVWWKARKEKQQGPASAIDPSGAASVAGTQIEPNQLRKAWNRYTDNLPAIYRRSILNFEHFVVLGLPASGKSRIIDAYSDWSRQAKGLPGSQSQDPNLPVYLASGIVITKLPARYLTEHSARAIKALKNLWGPLYKKRAPTVVVALDARQLKDNTPEQNVELADSIRARVDMLSSIRGKSIEVRVALTYLDSIGGYGDFAAFCREQNIPTKIALDLKEGADPLPRQLEDWFDGMRDHLSHALTTLPSTSYLRVVSFLRQAPTLTESLGKFLSALLVRNVLSRDPLFGGVYLVSAPPGVSNPLTRADERGPGPDPRRWHLLATTVAASAAMAYLFAAYRSQRVLYDQAAIAAGSYDATLASPDTERKLRQEISRFTYQGRNRQGLEWLDTHPDYFADARTELRRRFSKNVRENLLIPNLKRVAQQGRLSDHLPSLPTRRSLYYLELIHSDKRQGDPNNTTGILKGSKHDLWAQMTELPKDQIEDYLRNTDEAWKTQITFDVSDRDTELTQNWQIWTNFLRDLRDAMEKGAIRPDDLDRLKETAKHLTGLLERYEHDQETIGILDELDAAAGTKGELKVDQTSGTKDEPKYLLRDAYAIKYADYISNAKSHRVIEQRDQLKAILRVVRAGSVDAQGQHLLKTLIEKMSALYDSSGGDDEPIKVTMAQQEYIFDPRKWRSLMRDSRGSEMILQFIRAAATSSSIFFGPEQDAELRPVVWNPSNDGSAIFTGKALLEARYTKVAYDNHVFAQVLKLTEALERAKVPEDQKRQLNDFVRDRVRRYAAEYRSQVVAFVRGYGLRAPSQEALRVALVQMSKADASAFNDFLAAVDQNTRLEFPNPLLEPMRDVVHDFNAWHSVVGGDGGAPEVTKYRAILSQILTDLGPEGAGAPSAADALGPETLEKALTPAGKLVLQEVKGDKGSYAQLVNDWLLSVRLPDYQRFVFTLPISELTRLGRRDIERVLAVVWENDLLPHIRRVAARFPFDPASKEDVTPADLTTEFHPQTGRYFDVFRRYFEPISDFGNGAPFRLKPSVRGRLSLPPRFYELTNVVALLSSRLWDETGKPIPLPVRVATVPFEHGRNPKLALTLVYMNVGTASFFNFNQRPAQVTLQIDWTKEYNAQVGLQLTDIDTKENVFPDPLAAEGSFWAFLRLLKKGQAEPARYPPGAHLHTWPFKIAREGSTTMVAQYVVIDDLWDMFALGGFVRTRLVSASSPAGL